MTGDVMLSEEIRVRAVDVTDEADKILAVDASNYPIALDICKRVKNMQKTIDDDMNPGIDQAHKLHKHLVAQKKNHIDKLKDAEHFLKNRISLFLRREETKRLEQQRKAEEEARVAEEKRKETLQKQADQWEQKGNNVKAEKRREMAEQVHVPTPIIPDQVEKQEGIQTQTIWKFEITNEMDIPREYLTPDLKSIGGCVRAMKDKTKIAGVRIYSEDIVKVRT